MQMPWKRNFAKTHAMMLLATIENDPLRENFHFFFQSSKHVAKAPNPGRCSNFPAILAPLLARLTTKSIMDLLSGFDNEVLLKHLCKFHGAAHQRFHVKTSEFIGLMR